MINALLVWHPTATVPPADLPDADLEVLVYDDSLDDTVVAALDSAGDRQIFVEICTRQELPSPRWWAHKPYPYISTKPF